MGRHRDVYVGFRVSQRRATFSGPYTGFIALWDLFWGSPIYGNNHLKKHMVSSNETME